MKVTKICHCAAPLFDPNACERCAKTTGGMGSWARGQNIPVTEHKTRKLIRRIIEEYEE
jgi:hypothetical protein